MLKPDGSTMHFDHALMPVVGDKYALAVQTAENCINRLSGRVPPTEATLSGESLKQLALAFLMLHDRVGPIPGVSAPEVTVEGVRGPVVLPGRLEGALEAALQGAPKITGTYDFENGGLSFYEETLTLNEIGVAVAFGKWLIANHKTYGYNLPVRYAEFYREMAEAVTV